MLEHLRAYDTEISCERIEGPNSMRLALNAMKAGDLDKQWDIVLCDYVMPGFGAEAALRLLHESDLDLPFIVVSGQITVDIAVSIMKAGSHDYVMKSDLTRLNHAIEREVAGAKLRNKEKQINQEMIESEQRFRAIADYTYAWESWVTTDRALKWVNPVVEKLSGYTAEECYAMDDYPLQFIHSDDQAIISQKLSRALNGAVESNVSFRIIQKHGQLVWIEGSWQSIKNDFGVPLGYRASFRDITKRKENEEKLHVSTQVFKKAHEGIMITSAEGTIVDVNPAFTEITGYNYQDAVGNSPRILKSGRESPEFYAAMWRKIIKHGYWQGEIWNRKKNGDLFAEKLTISSLNDSKGQTKHYLCLFSDVTEIKQRQQKMEQMAHFDGLTNLPNRLLFSDRFDQIVAHSKRTKTEVAVCFLDLDNFKPVNDRYGHDVGDKLLIEVARRIKDVLREGDTVSRQGGDEFTLLLGDVKAIAQCEKRLSRIHKKLALPYFISGHNFEISASIGVTIYPTDNSDLGTLLRHADQALYQAKSVGKNQYCFFNAKQDQQLKEKKYQLDEIQQAMDNDELVLYYQPKVNMRTGEVFGVEALLRWLHPEKGIILPLDFLPLTDGTALDSQIGQWVIGQALKQLDQWNKKGIKLEVSVNITTYHLLETSFIDQLQIAIAPYAAFQANNLQLEVLESSVFCDVKKIGANIKACQDRYGLLVALDDFGTGYSSLTHLRNLSVNTIKIDKTFVQNMLDDKADHAIVTGVIGLAAAFNREVVAEGVETTEHGTMLLKMGCERAQGYGIARPMPANAFPVWLNSYVPNHEWLACDN